MKNVKIETYKKLFEIEKDMIARAERHIQIEAAKGNFDMVEVWVDNRKRAQKRMASLYRKIENLEIS